MTEPKWILEDSVLAIHSMQLAEHGGSAGIRNIDLLASALDRPKNKYAYESTCFIFKIAAAYGFGIAKNHPFVDGNKRTAFLCSTLFLELNGYQFAATEPDAVVTFENLASGKIQEDELAEWLELNSSKA
ncbi:MAG: type II toxin-antitoxin system death-on-curing family toxin [Gammaproteobacteria bacterium]|nr:type II toxin-antitoxin system death-on-curing family toxin [Gammaproteobacteria bacterium]